MLFSPFIKTVIKDYCKGDAKSWTQKLKKTAPFTMLYFFSVQMAGLTG